jgi:hypothetical protein
VSKREYSPFVVLAAVFGASSLVCLALAAWETIAVRRLVLDGVRTTGTVVRVDASSVDTPGRFGSGTTKVSAAAVRFTDESGVAHEVTSDGTTRDIRVGSTLDVRYPPEDPGRGRAFVGSPWSGVWSLAMLGAAAGWLACFCYALSPVRRRRPLRRGP